MGTYVSFDRHIEISNKTLVNGALKQTGYMDIDNQMMERIVSSSLFIMKLSEATGFKFLKGRLALKKTVGQIVFEVLFFSSKWNDADNIEINADFRVSYKKYGVASTIHSIIASKSIEPENNCWFDISTEEQFDKTFQLFEEKINMLAVDMSDRFEEDFNLACEYLLDEKFYDYNVKLDFLEEVLGTEKVKYRIDEIIEALSDSERQQIEDYRGGARNKQWMINRCNMRFIVDKGYYS